MNSIRIDISSFEKNKFKRASQLIATKASTAYPNKGLRILVLNASNISFMLRPSCLMFNSPVCAAICVNGASIEIYFWDFSIWGIKGVSVGFFLGLFHFADTLG